MLRVPPGKSYLKRTIRPLYGWSQATPVSAFLDPMFDPIIAGCPIWPGMAFMKTVGECFAPLNADGIAFGLSSFYEGGENLFEISEQGINACAIWVLSEQAQFEILAPAFDNTVPWIEPTDGSIAPVHAYTAGPKRGKLCPANPGTLASGTTVSSSPIARLMKVGGPNQIEIAGLQARTV